MKKFIKSKIDICSEAKVEENAEANASPPKVEDQTYTATDNSSEEAKPAVYPPLPLDPPPPESPPNLNILLKQEVEDVEYQTSPKEEASEAVSQTEELFTEFKTDCSEESPDNRSNPPICRDFIRGTCTRPGTCKYTHKFDITQLAGVYTFCRNYQNSVCTFPNCRYAHATVFEEQHFYRTGILPPHALAHHKKGVQPPPPPPPPEESLSELPPDFSNPPPPLPSNNETPMPAFYCMPSTSTESMFEGSSGGSSLKDDVLNIDWSEFEGDSSIIRLKWRIYYNQLNLLIKR